ncbi:MAG: hypothetical protein PHG96_13265 [Kiritimatiellae bacterium]|nr:hypothetical protein [Kiritimatiellia bacterium]MDD3546309.1 hypothetical protein [Kiritimatiellia bacterium]MDD4026418.1 hypothetical protein [Kiritimatiellia bacterium]MDD4623233.1 hypothetical protein [Kiritimatiellia bacterium]
MDTHSVVKDFCNNYVEEAITAAVKVLKALPLSLRMLRDTHTVLLSGSRSERKAHGEFRASKNWLGGSSGATITQAKI